MVHRRSIPILGVLALTAAGLVACSDSGNGADGDAGGEVEPAADGPIELRMTVWTADESQLALFDEIAEEYIEENRELDSGVDFEVVPFDD